MRDLLEFLLLNCPLFFEGNRYRFVDSESSDSFGGNAYITLSGESVRIRLVRERGQLFADFQPIGLRGKKGWFSIDVVRRLIIDEQSWRSIMDRENAEFLREHLLDIERLFLEDEQGQTLIKLKRLEKLRAKEIFR